VKDRAFELKHGRRCDTRRSDIRTVSWLGCEASQTNMKTPPKDDTRISSMLCICLKLDQIGAVWLSNWHMNFQRGIVVLECFIQSLRYDSQLVVPHKFSRVK
jgi:hypothetical protein